VTTAPVPDSGINSLKGDKNRRPWDIQPGLAVVLTAIIGLIGGVIGRTTAPDNTQPTPGPTVTATVTASPSPTVPAANLQFALTVNSKVPWCQVYSGTGTIPTGYSFVFFDTPADPDGQPASPASYSFDGVATEVAADHWRTEKLEVGTLYTANDNIDIVGVLTSESTYTYINSILTQRDAQWTSKRLPPGPRATLPVITNGKHGLPCQ
jgi:hypothetical protein